MPKLSNNKDQSFEDLQSFEVFSRMFIDGDRAKNSDDIVVEFEKSEPGYFISCFRALDYLLTTKNLNERICSADILTFHSIALRDVENTNFHLYNIEAKFRLHSANTGYTIPSINKEDKLRVYATEEGICEWYDFSLTDNNYSDFYRLDDDLFRISSKQELLEAFRDNQLQIMHKGPLYWHSSERTEKSIYCTKPPLPMETIVDKYLYAFYDAVQFQPDHKERLRLICQLIQRLERLHPFIDGNGRTLSILLFNYLLITNGFYPAIQTSPNRVDGLSLKQLVEQVKVDIYKSKRLLECKNTEEMNTLLQEIEEQDSSSLPGTPPVLKKENGKDDL